jgi:hypothetical protein
MAQQPPTLLGCVSEAFGDALDGYLESNPDRLLAGKDKGKEKDKAGMGKSAGAAAGMCLDRWCCCMLVPGRDGVRWRASLAQSGQVRCLQDGSSFTHSTPALTVMHFLQDCTYSALALIDLST